MYADLSRGVDSRMHCKLVVALTEAEVLLTTGATYSKTVSNTRKESLDNPSHIQLLLQTSSDGLYIADELKLNLGEGIPIL
jgi:hypothetical protein